MRLGEADLEALEWGGLLHDVGKIGVPDAVLLKQDRLTKEERTMMNSHPVLGAQIIKAVTRLSRELPIIRHHHEWYNGSGYPDRLIGDEIPLLARDPARGGLVRGDDRRPALPDDAADRRSRRSRSCASSPASSSTPRSWTRSSRRTGSRAWRIPGRTTQPRPDPD